MKQQLERTYDRPVVTSGPDPIQNKFGVLAIFVAVTAGTFLVASSLASLKGGVWNLLFVVAAMLGVVLVAVALPQVLENWKYLRPRLNKWHLVWYGVYISSLVFRIRQLAEFKENPIDGWALLRIGPEGFIGLYLLILLASRRLLWTKSLFSGLPKVLAIYSAFCLSSTIWSIFPPWTAYKSMEFLLDVSVMAAILAVVTKAEDYKTLFDFTWAMYGFEAVWCWMQIGIWPKEALDDSRLKGIFPLTGYNALGEYGALLAIVAFARLIPVAKLPFKRSWYFSVLAFGVATMIAANTRNAIGGLALAMVLVLILSRGMTGALLVAISTAGVIFTALGAFVEKFMKRGQSDEAFDSLSGRMLWWHYAWLQFLLHPILGFGAYAAGKFAVMMTLNVNSGSTHSDYIELLVGTGVVGTLLFVFAILWSWRLLYQQTRDVTRTPLERQLALESFGVMTVLVVHSFFNVELIWHAPLFFLVVLGYAELLRRQRDPRMANVRYQ